MAPSTGSSRIHMPSRSPPDRGSLAAVSIPLVHNQRLVIFDCDGVLVDSEPISNRVLAEALTVEGLRTTLEHALGEYKGLLLSEIVARVEARLGRPLSDGWVERFESDRAEAFRRELAPVPGAAEAVRGAISAGWEVCVASQGRFTAGGRMDLQIAQRAAGAAGECVEPSGSTPQSR
jgi:beta-phosphoglucomutase-like phosphatase (HAD superfamily)